MFFEERGENYNRWAARGPLRRKTSSNSSLETFSRKLKIGSGEKNARRPCQDTGSGLHQEQAGLRILTNELRKKIF